METWPTIDLPTHDHQKARVVSVERCAMPHTIRVTLACGCWFETSEDRRDDFWIGASMAIQRSNVSNT